MLKIYQSFFNSKEYRHLDKAFIPFNNLENAQPELREYPLLKKLYEKNINFNGHWGMLSWRWKQKTNIDGKKLIAWIEENPSYDVYMINPNSYIPELHRNSIVQGEPDHPGIIEFTNELLNNLGYNFNIEHVDFPLNIFSTCHFYIGNPKFWDKWIAFMDLVVDLAKKNEKIHKYLYVDKTLYQGNQLINFCFAMERLVSLFLYLNLKEYRVKHYPYQYFLKKTDKELEFTGIKEKALLLLNNPIY